MSALFEGDSQAHRVKYFGFAIICKKMVPEIKYKQGWVRTYLFGIYELFRFLNFEVLQPPKIILTDRNFFYFKY